jgi:hypothetical protein
MAKFPLTICSVSVLEQVIAMVDECLICIGNPDAKFEQLALSRKGEFTNARGT